MVAVIKVSSSIHRIFNYNENKVREGAAECIGAGNYPLDPSEMSAKIKLNFLLKRIELNENVKRNSIHISLNFDPSESHLTQHKLTAVAGVYMNKLGFGEQPYLVYQHFDAGHPHIHIVTTNIRSNGSRIDLHHLGIRKSEPARKEIEKMFGLVVADQRSRQQAFRLEPVNAAKVQYGRSATKRAITNVLDAVLEKYRFTSLPELNAVLGLYNVKADRGSENSRIFKGGGVVYRILGEDGSPIGVPIKASDFYSKPTLKYLKARYAANENARSPHKSRIRNAVDMALLGRISVQELAATLDEQGISVLLRQNDAGLIYGITFIDHKTYAVFNGSALGKAYSAKGLQERCLATQGPSEGLNPPSIQPSVSSDLLLSQHLLKGKTGDTNGGNWESDRGQVRDVLGALLQPSSEADYLPAALKRKRRRKKRKNVSNL